MILGHGYLSVISGHHGGLIPQPMDMTDDQKDALIQEALSNPDDRDQMHEILIELIRDNGLACIFHPDPKEAQRLTINNLYAALESDLADDIDDYNGQFDSRPVTGEERFMHHETEIMEGYNEPD